MYTTRCHRRPQGSTTKDAKKKKRVGPRKERRGLWANRASDGLFVHFCCRLVLVSPPFSCLQSEDNFFLFSAPFAVPEGGVQHPTPQGNAWHAVPGGNVKHSVSEGDSVKYL